MAVRGVVPGRWQLRGGGAQRLEPRLQRHPDRARRGGHWNGKAWTPTPVAVPGQHNASGFAAVTCRPGKPVFCAAVGYVGPWGSQVSSTLSGFWNGTRWTVILPAQ